MTQAGKIRVMAVYERSRDHAGPIRTCVGCRSRDLQSALVRIARDKPTGRVVVDSQSGIGGRLPGRGAYVHPVVSCLDADSVRVGLARSFRARVHNENVATLCAHILKEGHRLVMPRVSGESR